jgi:amino acid transporter
MLVLILLGVVILGGVVYLAISKKSSFKLKIAALGALALMILTVIICLFIIFGGKSAVPTDLLPDAQPSEAPPPADPPNPAAGIMLVIFLIAVFLLVLIVSLRDRKKQNAKKDNAEISW